MKLTPIYTTGITCLTLAATAMIVAPTAEAQVYIINQNFNSSTLPSGVSFGDYFGGNTTSGSIGINSTAGVGGSGAMEIVSFGQSGGSAGYSYYGGQYQDVNLTGNTSANLSDYTLSFDAMAYTLSLNGSASPGSLNLQIQSFTGPGLSGTVGTLNTAPANPGYGNDQTLTGSYTHYSLNLGNTSIFQDNTGFVPTSSVMQIAFQLNYGGATPYAAVLDVDNLQLTMVPEPASLALCGMGLLGGLLALRRRKV
jgi:PEP-CTERM motif